MDWVHFGYSVAVGDVNGDGRGDIAAARLPGGGSGQVFVFSGTNGSLLLTVNSPLPYGGFGASMAVGDVDGDGKADIAVGAPSAGSNYGRVYVFSGADGSQFPWSPLISPNVQVNAVFGDSVAVGDVTGDGKADIVVGAHGEGVGGNTSQGRVYVFSGADGSQLPWSPFTTPYPQTDAWFGRSVAAGDADGDGKADIAVGAYMEDVGGTSTGRAYVFSGADGSLLLTLDTPNPQTDANFGYSLAMGEMDGDGMADVAVGAPWEDVSGRTDQGRVYVFSSSPPPVGGIAELPNVPQGGSPARNFIILAGGVAVALLALTAGAWHAKRRWGR